MQIDIETGLLDVARQVPSPHFDERPEGGPVDLVVLHNISLPPGEYGGPWIDQLFCGCLDPEVHPYFLEICGLKVSAHLLIRRDGEIIQYVPFNKRAWHAGESNYMGRECCNDFSIGIELEGSDEEPYSDVQYLVLSEVITKLCNSYPDISQQRITGHCDIAPGRKSDPGPAFEWKRLAALLADARVNRV